MTIGARVKLRRQAKGWSQNELARRSGMSHTHVGAIEEDRHSPTLLALQKIADAFGVGLGDLIGTDPVPTNPVVAEIVAAATAMEPERQNMLRDLARAVLFTAGMTLAAS